MLEQLHLLLFFNLCPSTSTTTVSSSSSITVLKYSSYRKCAIDSETDRCSFEWLGFRVCNAAQQKLPERDVVHTAGWDKFYNCRISPCQQRKVGILLFVTQALPSTCGETRTTQRKCFQAQLQSGTTTNGSEANFETCSDKGKSPDRQIKIKQVRNAVSFARLIRIANRWVLFSPYLVCF